MATNMERYLKEEVRGNVQKIQRHCPYRRGGGQPHFKKVKRNDFFDKSWRGRGSQNKLSKIEAL